MSSNYFYTQIERSETNAGILDSLKDYANQNSVQIYAILEPLGEEKYNYEYKDALVVLIPGYKILVINLGNYEDEEFTYFCEDFIEDLSHISDKFAYKTKIGRPRDWKRNQFEFIDLPDFDEEDFIQSLNSYKIADSTRSRISELLVSLLTGSINSIDKIEIEEPNNLLDKVKQKIVLFDSDQTRFIFGRVTEPKVIIQGLAGTGKTELLMHKLKELYVRDSNSKIAFTCFSKTLASNLKKRVPEFFTFMKVDEQIQWNERLWVHSSWGSKNVPDSGLYSFICDHYDIPFQRYSWLTPFATVCRNAVSYLKKQIAEGNFKPYFDYILIDESQDFTEDFFELCQLVTKKTIYIAGDIFQNIFDNDYSQVNPDFLLNKVYRTDPRTLMFSHGVGLALFERPVVNWLEDREWEACGYALESHDKNYLMTREKLRRFEDIEEMKEISPVSLSIEKNSEILNEIIKIIHRIKNENSTVQPDDIGVVFVDDRNFIYSLIDNFAQHIENEFGWEVNKGYENKGQIENTLFVSNRNNIKGLEFPFLICVAIDPIKKSIKSRNTLYMTLTRSFISSHLVLSEVNKGLYEIWNRELKNIIENNRLALVKPESNEIMSDEQLQINDATYRTYEEIIQDLFIEYNISSDKQATLFKIIDAFLPDEMELSLNESNIREIIETNLRILNGKKRG